MNNTHQPYRSHREQVHQQEAVKEYLTRSELLKRYNIGNTTLYRWMNSEEINFPPPVYLSPRSPRWAESALKSWEQERKEASL